MALIPTKHAHKQKYGQLYGSSLSLAIAEYCQQQSGMTLLIAPDNLWAMQLLADLQFFLHNTPQEQQLILFPDWETLPYDQFSPHDDLISERLQALYQINSKSIVICAVSTLMQHICPPKFLQQQSLILKTDQILNIEEFRMQLEQSGYRCVNKVMEHGEFAVRGSIIDLFPMGSNYPYRIELFDNNIESLRLFDPDTQRTINKITQINILPAREFPLHKDSIALFRNAFREHFAVNPTNCPLYEAVSNGQYPNGIEYYLPLFFEKTATLFDYMPENASICLLESTQLHAEKFWQEIQTRYTQRCHDLTRPILAPQHIFLSPTELLTKVNTFAQIRFNPEPIEKKGNVLNLATQPPQQYPIDRNATQPLINFTTNATYNNSPCILVVESAGRRETLLDLLQKSQITPQLQTSWQECIQQKNGLHIIVGPLTQGAVLLEPPLKIVVEAQLFGESPVMQRRSTNKTVDPDLIIRDLAELSINAPVVHLDFGVGRYQGLQTITRDNQANEFLVLQYADNDKIYVPVTALHLISRYTGADSEHAPLHKLGSDQWQKAKKKAIEKIHDVAIELLDLYAKRAASPGYAHAFDKNEYQRFASGFPFIETTDQQHAIEAIISDMRSTKPMDRLICGDVGFGKTEVAMRAAFIAVQNNQQVCVLVPTTLLAGQHFETFRDRFADFPVNIELLSRFRTPKETQRVIAASADGKVDIVIGTHKLFQKDLKFKNLGLLIIDEEHRFGVKQKEAIKAIRNNIDTLCMTATPIPRTLNMAMAGIRDISLIATPPAKRLSIKTFWQERQDASIREAILREILRGGQVFFLHNNVKTIMRIHQELQTLIPEAKISYAHGQMRERELEKIMSDFYHQRFNVLICTTIIETGIDIPTANTIIIDDADQLGLAQLHQLRGRVGRSHHQAYAYLFTKNPKLITKDAAKRLDAIVSLEALGSGFILATHDLEIRGAGELLGEDQSGNMHAIGFTLFMDLLNQAVEDLQSGKIPALNAPMHQGPEINLNMSAIIPEDYINDVHTRLIMYKRIANAKHNEELRKINIELIDRFGLLPIQVKQLFLITELKIVAQPLGIKRIQATDTTGIIDFEAQAKINPGALINLIQLHSAKYKLEGPTRLRFTLTTSENAKRVEELIQLLQHLS
jgi:transcription-repair coupling factor (superfamily II helicase)